MEDAGVSGCWCSTHVSTHKDEGTTPRGNGSTRDAKNACVACQTCSAGATFFMPSARAFITASSCSRGM